MAGTRLPQRIAPWDPAAAQRFVTSDGTALHLEDSGPAGAALTLVLLHGWTLDHRTWDRVVPRLTLPGLRVLRYDHRGHGGSAPAPPGTATVAQAADDLAELITRRVLAGRVVLAGHSMGGMAIMALAERHPDLLSQRVAAVAMVATSCGGLHRATLGLPGVAGSLAAGAERALFRALARRRTPVTLGHAAVLRPGTRLLTFGRGADRAGVAATAAQIASADPASVAAFRASIGEHDRRRALDALSGVPAVIMAGERDRLCPASHAQVIADALPGAEFVRYPGAGHMLPVERPDGVAAHLDRLLRDP